MVVHPRRQVWSFRTCHKDGSPSYTDPTPISRCHQSRCLETLRSPARGKWSFDHVFFFLYDSFCSTTSELQSTDFVTTSDRRARNSDSNGH
jgi:hypothetical protein